MSAACRARPTCSSSSRRARPGGRSSRRRSTPVSPPRSTRSCSKQVAAGIDSVCDGELGKISYTFYVRHRLSGIGAFRGGDNDQPPQTAAHRDLLDHPDFHAAAATRSAAAPRGSAARRCRAASARSPTGSPAARRRSGQPRRRLRRGQADRGVHERGLAGGADQVRARPLLPERGRLCRSAGRRAEGGIRGDPPGRLYPADRRARSRLGPAQPVPAPLRRRIPARSPSAISPRSTMRPPTSRPRRCACICAGAITRGRTPTTSRSPRSSTCDAGAPAGLSFEAANPRHAHEWEDLRERQDPRRQGADPRGHRLRRPISSSIRG